MKNNSNKSREQLEVLMEDYKITNEKIEQFMRNQFNHLNTAFLLIGGFFAFIYASSSGDTYPNLDKIVWLPLFVALICGLLLYHYQRIMGLQGYKISLENAINEHLGQPTLLYGYIGMNEMVKKNPFQTFNLFIYIAVYLFISGASYVITGDFLWSLIHLLVLVGLLIMSTKILSFSKEFYKISQDIRTGKIKVEDYDKR